MTRLSWFSVLLLCPDLFWHYALVRLFLLFSFSCVYLPLGFLPFVTSPVLSPPHSPPLFLIPSLVCLRIKSLFSLHFLSVPYVICQPLFVSRWSSALVSLQCLLVSPVWLVYYFGLWFSLFCTLPALRICFQTLLRTVMFSRRSSMEWFFNITHAEE